jgi:hypothetical protein
MLRNVGIVLMIAAALCALPPAIGYFENGQFLWPGFSIGGLLDSVSLTEDRLGPFQPFLRPLLPFNPGWILLFIGLICYMAAGRKGE